MSISKATKLITVRGNVVCMASGKGLKGASIEILENNKSELKFETSRYGLFLFELNRSKEYCLQVNYKVLSRSLFHSKRN
jgi:hypothetical protein